MKSPSRNCYIEMVVKYRKSGFTADKKRSGSPEQYETMLRSSVFQTAFNKIQATENFSNITMSHPRSYVASKDLTLYPYKTPFNPKVI